MAVSMALSLRTVTFNRAILESVLHAPCDFEVASSAVALPERSCRFHCLKGVVFSVIGFAVNS